MLVLTRKLGEDVIIADNIRLTVVAIQGKKVRLGITAPATVSIVREELRQTAEVKPLKSGSNNERAGN
jgi:carbon storage regulator